MESSTDLAFAIEHELQLAKNALKLTCLILLALWLFDFEQSLEVELLWP